MKNLFLLMIFFLALAQTKVQANSISGLIGEYLIMHESKSSLDAARYLEAVGNIAKIKSQEIEWKKKHFDAYLLNSQLADAVKLSKKHGLTGADVFLVKLIFYINTNKIHQVKKIINAADLSRVIKSRLTKVFDSYNQNQSVTIEDKRVVLDVIKSDEFANQFLRESYDIGFTQLLFSLARSHLVPDDDNVNYELASFYQYAGNNDKAIFYYFKIPNNSELYLPSLNALATLLLELKNDQIRKEAIHVIKDKCDPVTCDLIDAIMTYNADNFTLAADKFERVLSDNRHFDSACYHTPHADGSLSMRTQISLLMLMYHAYYKSGRYDDFKKTILCVIQQHKIPDGRIMNVLKSIDNAFVSSGPQIANKKSLVDHINYLGYSMILEDDDINLALSLLKLAGEFSPDDPYLLDSIAWGYYKMGDYVHANSTIARALTLMPGEPEVLIHAGEIWNAMGWYKLAAGAWDKALQIGLEILDEKRMNELREKIKQLEKKLNHMPSP